MERLGDYALIREILRAWDEMGVVASQIPNEVDLVAFERRVGRTLPSDLRCFYRAFGGMEEGAMERRSLLRFWPLAEVAAASTFGFTGPEYGGYFVFADHSLWSHGYAILLPISDEQGHTPIALVSHLPPHIVATSFAEFLERYWRDPTQLFPMLEDPVS